MSKTPYHSALSEPLALDGFLNFHASEGSTVFQHDITHGVEVYQSYPIQALYSELSWRAGYDKFMARAGTMGSFNDYLTAISGVIATLKLPTYLVLGKHMLKALEPPQTLAVTLHGKWGSFLGVWNADVPPVQTSEGVLGYIAETYSMALDFSCGYGNLARAMLSKGKKFVCTDINGKCVYYVAKELMGYKP